ncbi:MAG: SCO family protein [bacterium]|nr:SCO family protein [bacterium]
MPKKVIIILIGLLLVLGIAISALVQTRPGSNVPAQSGSALIGGAFELTDHTGKQVSDKDYLGKLMLVYFGFTYCPDICPTELQHIAGALDIIGDKRRKQITPLFVTIDPERDTRELMASYVENFHPDLVGLIGTTEQIKKMGKNYRVYFKKVVDKDSPDGYTMDHSALVFLMDKKGRYIRHFSYSTTPQKMAEGLIKAMN